MQRLWGLRDRKVFKPSGSVRICRISAVSGTLSGGWNTSIHGRALTTDGGVIPNATITLMSVFDSRVSGQVRTNAEGNYSITTSEPGEYTLTAARCNYQASADTVVFPFDDNSNRTVDFHLRKGPACS